MPNYDVLTTQLAEAVGTANLVTDPAQLAAYSVDGVTPRFVAGPTDVAGVQAVIRACAAQGASVIPRGHGSKMRLGNPPKSADVILSLAGLNRVVEYDVDNLTVIVQAGVVLEALQGQVMAHKQLLPLDPPFPSAATIGGVIAANASGPRRLAYGAARDLVLGMKVVIPNGDLISPGGKTVKNVAGYDLDKLFIGSLGTLGVVVEAAFRLLPLPEKRATLLAAFPSLEQATAMTTQLLKSQYLPTALEILNPRALEMSGLGQNTFALVIALEGVTEAVDRQVKELSALCQAGGSPAVEVVTDQAEANLWLAVRDLPRQIAAKSPGVVSCKASVVLSGVTATCQAATQSASRRGLTLALEARGGNGIIYAWFLGQEGDETRQAEAAQELRAATTAAGGSMILGAGPLAVKQAVGVWGSPGSDIAVMRAIKARLDPLAILNPGRYVGGI